VFPKVVLVGLLPYENRPMAREIARYNPLDNSFVDIPLALSVPGCVNSVWRAYLSRVLCRWLKVGASVCNCTSLKQLLKVGMI
jgi:hypothetical protein